MMYDSLTRSVATKFVALFFAVGTIYAASLYPLDPILLAVLLLTYAGLLCWRPVLWLLLVPACLPLLDIAPWTGWFFLEEVDLVLLVTAAIGYWRLGMQAPSARLPHFVAGCLMLLSVAYLIGTVVGLGTMPALDDNAFASYYSRYNSLRVAKGFFWALVLLLLLLRSAGPGLVNLRRYFLPGMLIGLAGVCAAATWERMVFPGLLNFASDYRITAPFSAMHTGGAALDGYLVLALPFVVLWLAGERSRIKALVALGLLVAGLFIGMATFSRGVYLAYGCTALLFLLLAAIRGARAGTLGLRKAAGIVLLLAVAGYGLSVVFAASGYRGLAAAMAGLGIVWLIYGLRDRRRRLDGASVRFVACCGAALAMAIPLTGSNYTTERFATVGNDLTVRLNHWQEALAMMSPGWQTSLFGMGLGRYPETYFRKNTFGEMPSTYRYEYEKGNNFLRLGMPETGGGSSEVIRMLQRVAITPGTRYIVSLDVRTRTTNAGVSLAVCERLLLYARDCVDMHLPAPLADNQWHHHEVQLDSGSLGAASWLLRPPTQLQVSLYGGKAQVDIDNISVLDRQASLELIRNGSFTDANDYWFFSSDHYHLPWHVKNFVLNVFFELGWFGVVALGLLMAYAFGSLAQASLGGSLAAGVYLASLSGFMLVGLFDSLLDVPRLALLFFIVLLMSTMQPLRVKPVRVRRRRSSSATIAVASAPLPALPPQEPKPERVRRRRRS